MQRGIPEAQIAHRLQTQPHFTVKFAQWNYEKRMKRLGMHLALMLRLYVAGRGFTRVTFTRCSPKLCDGDNVQHAFKFIRDGFAKYYGVDDADWREGAIQWDYEQERTPYFAIRARLTLRAGATSELCTSSPITSISRRRG